MQNSFDYDKMCWENKKIDEVEILAKQVSLQTQFNYVSNEDLQ